MAERSPKPLHVNLGYFEKKGSGDEAGAGLLVGEQGQQRPVEKQSSNRHDPAEFLAGGFE